MSASSLDKGSSKIHRGEGSARGAHEGEHELELDEEGPVAIQKIDEGEGPSKGAHEGEKPLKKGG